MAVKFQSEQDYCLTSIKTESTRGAMKGPALFGVQIDGVLLYNCPIRSTRHDYEHRQSESGID
jgi:hypothetical protein